MFRLGFLILVVCGAVVSAQPEKQPFKIPEPKGWNKETIALPPQFAADMKWKGIEEIRFAPGMFTAEAKDFFSYALLFWLPDDQKIDAKTIEQELLAYYRGLAKAVAASKKKEVDAAAFTLTITETKEKTGKRPGGETVNAYLGELKWVEPFVTGKAQTLRFEIHVWVNVKHKHTCLFICASPQPESAEVWKTLRVIRDGVTFE